MALEGSYEYECMRAELLGTEKPDYEEFMKIKGEREAAEKVQSEIELLKEHEAEKEQLKDANNKVDDLNNILKSTQTKLNKFAMPFSNFLKTKLSSFDQLRRNSKESIPTPQESSSCSSNNQNNEGNVEQKLEHSNNKEPEEKRLSHLDLLNDKMERAQLSMQSQNKRMKSLLKK